MIQTIQLSPSFMPTKLTNMVGLEMNKDFVFCIDGNQQRSRRLDLQEFYSRVKLCFARAFDSYRNVQRLMHRTSTFVASASFQQQLHISAQIDIKFLIIKCNSVYMI